MTRDRQLAPLPALALVAAAAIFALVASHPASVAALGGILLALCLRAGWRRARLYLYGIAISTVGILVLWPLTAHVGGDPIWNGPILKVVGSIDITTEEVRLGFEQALRLATVGLAFTAYALLLDHDRLVRQARWMRRSALTVALATRLVPTLASDASGLLEALRGRGVETSGLRGHARLLSPLVAGSLERAMSLAEAMEARGYGGRPTLRRRAPFSHADSAALFAAATLVVSGVLWL